MVTDIVSQLTRDEGLRLKPYLDSVGKVTIGVGRNLTDTGINQEESDLMLQHDIAHAQAMIEQNIPWAQGMDPIRYAVLVNMTFNMGIGGVLGFRDTLDKMRTGDYVGAAQAMLQSKWADQVGDRAQRLALQMEKGEWV